MNNYEAKKAAKKEHYAEKAGKLEAEAQALYEYDHKQMDLIPLGQPILVGHHSEKGHRAALKRSHNRLNKMRDLQNKAEYYQRKASSTNYAISSDDEDAISKLKNKLVELEAYQAKMKRINNEFRKGGFEAVTGIDEQTKELFKIAMQKYSWEKSPYPRYELTNNNAKIRSVKQRIAELENLQAQPSRESIVRKGYTVTENQEDNRIWFQFDEKPIAALCQVLKKYGFKWSPGRKAWVRMLNAAGCYSVECVLREIGTLLATTSKL